jgi:hypothetical protein
MKGYYGFNSEGHEVFYVPQNFLLKKSGRKIVVDSDPSHLEELTIYFSENKNNLSFAESVQLPDCLLRKFQRYCRGGNPASYLVANEIFDYLKDMSRLKSVIKKKNFFDYIVGQGYDSVK